MEEPRALSRVVLGAVLGLASMAELAARLVAGSTVRAGLAVGSATNTRVSVPTVTAERLFDAVRVIAAGEALLAPTVTKRLISEFARQRPRPVDPAQGSGALGRLTPRETEVLRLIAAGLSNPEIAKRLVVTEETVKTHVSRILSELGLRDRTQAVVAAYESGLVVPDADEQRS